MLGHAGCFARRVRSNVFKVGTHRRFCSNVLDILNRDIEEGGIVPVYKLAVLYDNRIAIQDDNGSYTYSQLFQAARKLSLKIAATLSGEVRQTITYLCPGNVNHSIAQWAIWMSGNIAVPLSPQHPLYFLQYFIEDSGSALTICDESFLSKLSTEDNDDNLIVLSSDLVSTQSNETTAEKSEDEKMAILYTLPLGEFYANSDALVLYTSGTTSKPKGVVYGFKQLANQILSLHTAWRYKCQDVFLHTLPLHHVHGQVNSMNASLAAGATLRMLSTFNPTVVWKHLLGMDNNDKRVSVFMGVPTMYVKLIDEYNKVFSKSNRQKEYIRNYLSQNIRLMISGSAPLPNSVFENWENISGHRLLERYGMTETGMVLGNPYNPVTDRTPGYVGTPMPGASIQIVTTDSDLPLLTMKRSLPSLKINLDEYNFHSSSQNAKNLFIDASHKMNEKIDITFESKEKKNDIVGDLHVRGPGVFTHYWQRPDQTKLNFTNDGWFKTGDSVMYDGKMVRILGRTSIDIIKSGGYKISALDVETALLNHPLIVDIAVVGLPDEIWGEKVTAVIELKPDTKLSLKELQEWGTQYIPKYQLPSKLFIVEKIFRNVMGKVNKKELQKSLLKME